MPWLVMLDMLKKLQMNKLTILHVSEDIIFFILHQQKNKFYVVFDFRPFASHVSLMYLNLLSQSSFFIFLNISFPIPMLQDISRYVAPDMFCFLLVIYNIPLLDQRKWL